MNKMSGVGRFGALYSFVFVLIIFLAIAAFIPLMQFRGEVKKLATEDAVRDLQMLGSHMHESMIRHDYTAIRESMTLWGRDSERVVSIRAVAPNGFVFSEYHREETGRIAHPLSVSMEILQDGRLLATLHLTEDFAAFEHGVEKLMNRNIMAFVFFAVALGAVLWFTLRRAAILPMQRLVKEVQDLNLTLEERVRDRTADLGRANEDLEHEIGERVKAEGNLRESEERYRSIIRSAADGVLLMDLSAGEVPVITEVNESACRMHGYTREEMVGQPVSALADRATAKARKERRDDYRSGEALTFEVTHIRKDGSAFPLEVSAQPVSIGGKPHLIAVARDITERKEAEEVLRQAKESLERQNEELRKIDQMKDALIRDVSHELKTPVAKHAMQLEILQPLLEEGRLADSERQALTVMDKSVRRQMSVIRNLLNLARLESGGRQYLLEEVHLDKIVRKVLADYGESIDLRGITVSVDMPEIKLKSDVEMLWHVFSNIISNAIKFQRSENSPKISVSAWLEKDKAVVRIEDSGIGMDREVRESIFTRFFQASPSSEGSGIGLTICKRIVEDLGGQLSLESPGVDRGSVAEVRLPLS